MAGGAHEIAAINDIIGYSGIRVTREAVQGLVERGLVNSNEAPREEPEYRLTAEGRRLTIELMSAAKAVEIDALGSLTDDEQRILRDLLTRLAAGMTASEDERATRHLDLVHDAVSTARAHS